MPTARIGDIHVHYDIRPAHALLLATRIHAAYLETLTNTGHGFFWEVPGDVAALLHKFCHAI